MACLTLPGCEMKIYQLLSLAGSNEYPVLESNSDFFVLLEPYSEIFEK